MSARGAFISVLVASITFACLGALTGATIGKVAPDYYRAVFLHGNLPEFNPIQVGTGLGAIQGFAAGIAISILVLAILSWRDIRIASIHSGMDSPAHARSSNRWTVHILWGIATSGIVVLVAAAAFILGAITGQQQLYSSWTERKLDKLALILDSGNFAGVEAGHSSAAQVYLTGTLKDSETLDTLRNQLESTFGTEETEQILRNVEVSP